MAVYRQHYFRRRHWCLVVAVSSFVFLSLIQHPFKNHLLNSVTEVVSRIRQAVPTSPDQTRSAQLRFTRSSRTSWYGIEAYPSLKNRETSWQWLMVFIESIGRPVADDCNAGEPLSVSKAVQFITARTVGGDAVHIRFPNTTLSALETELTTVLLETTNKFDVFHPLRYDCIDKLCDRTQINQSIHLKPRWNLHNAEMVMVNFLFGDVYEVERLLEKSYRVETVITIVTTEHMNQTKDADYAMLLYDFFHKLYFEMDFVPVQKYSCQCKEKRYGCQMWIIWQSWSFKNDKRYFPPAGNGSWEHEMLRLASFVSRPNSKLCDRLQAFGGQWTEFDFVDGAWTLCLDLLPIQHFESCVVLSFGISTDWSFDDSMHSLGCSVYSFDPSIKLRPHKRNAHHWFYPWGLGANNGLISKGPRWKMFSLGDIQKRLLPLESRVSVLKMDIENFEWVVLRSKTLESELAGVDQLVLEIHPAPFFPLLESYLLHRLVKMGFSLIWSHQNPMFVNARSSDLNTSSNQLFYDLSFIRTASRLGTPGMKPS